MKIIFTLFFYQVILISLGLYLFFQFDNCSFCKFQPIWLHVVLLGMIGGNTYCIRSLYLQYCVKKEWDNRWIVWHITRPVVSAICGFISLIFLKAGFLLFEVSTSESHSYYGIYALTFIAGFNVDNFIKKIESIFKETLGIQQTRASMITKKGEHD